MCKEVDGGERAVSEVQAMALLAVKGEGEVEWGGAWDGRGGREGGEVGISIMFHLETIKYQI